MKEEVRQKVLAEYEACKKIATYLSENKETELVKNLIFPYFTYVGIQSERKIFKKYPLYGDSFENMIEDTLTRIVEKYSKECNHDFPLFFDYNKCFYCLDCGRVFMTEDFSLIEKAKKNSDDLLTYDDIVSIMNATEEVADLGRYFLLHDLAFEPLNQEFDNLLTFRIPIRREYLNELLTKPSDEALNALIKKKVLRGRN